MLEAHYPVHTTRHIAKSPTVVKLNESITDRFSVISSFSIIYKFEWKT